MGAGDEYLRSLGGAAHLHYVDAQSHPFEVRLALDLLAGGQEGLGGLAARADAQAHRAGAGIDAGDHAGEDLVLLGGELVVDHPPLGLPHTLDDHLAGGLGGDAAEIAGAHLDADDVAKLGVGQLLPCHLEAHLGAGVVDLLHHVLLDEHAHGTGLLVGLHGHVVPRALVVPLVGGHQGLGDFLQHVGLGDTLLLLNQVDGGKELRPVQLVGLLRFGILLRHNCTPYFSCGRPQVAPCIVGTGPRPVPALLKNAPSGAPAPHPF